MPRSGTSWVGRTLAHAEGYSYYREPDNFDHVPEAKPHFPSLYLGAKDHDEAYSDLIHKVFNRELTSLFVMKHDLGPVLSVLPDHLSRLLGRWRLMYFLKEHSVIKLVHSNLVLDWLERQYPDLKILYLTRHPAGQFASARRLGWEPNPAALLTNEQLVAEFLYPFEDHILSAKSFWQRAGARWGAINYVVHQQKLKQEGESRRALVPFEWLCEDPIQRFQETFERLEIPWNKKCDAFLTNSNSSNSDTPFSLERDSQLQRIKWKSEVNEDELKECAAFAEPFQLPFYPNFDVFETDPIW